MNVCCIGTVFNYNISCMELLYSKCLLLQCAYYCLYEQASMKNFQGEKYGNTIWFINDICILFYSY